MKQIMSLLIIFLISTALSDAQNIKYFDDQDHIVKQKKALYYREIFPDSIIDGAFLVKKYKIGAGLIESGYYKDEFFLIHHGKVIEYYPSGKIKYITYYDNNFYKEGETSFAFYENGAIRRMEKLSSGKFIGKCYLPDGSDTLYYPRYIPPTFQGNEPYSSRSFIQKSVLYPMDAREKNIQGTVLLYFCIDENDQICNIKITSDTHELINQAAINGVRKSAKYWKAGYEEGKKAKSNPIYMPLIFTLGPDSFIYGG